MDERQVPTVVLGKGGPTLINLRRGESRLRLLVTGPGMLFSNLRLVTTLDVFQGASVDALAELGEALEVTAVCGHTFPREAEVAVTRQRTGAALDIDLGPANMYQSEITVRTRTGETFDALLARVFGDLGDHLVAIHPVTATGHLEHAHGSIHKPPAPPDDGGHDHHHHGGGHGHP